MKPLVLMIEALVSFVFWPSKWETWLYCSIKKWLRFFFFHLNSHQLIPVTSFFSTFFSQLFGEVLGGVYILACVTWKPEHFSELLEADTLQLGHLFCRSSKGWNTRMFIRCTVVFWRRWKNVAVFGIFGCYFFMHGVFCVVLSILEIMTGVFPFRKKFGQWFTLTLPI